MLSLTLGAYARHRERTRRNATGATTGQVPGVVSSSEESTVTLQYRSRWYPVVPCA